MIPSVGSAESAQDTFDLPTFEKQPILLIDDDEDDALLVQELFDGIEGEPFALHWMPEVEAGLRALREQTFAAVLVDYRLGRTTGVEFIQRAQQVAEQVPALLLTSATGRHIDIKAMEAGAVDFLDKARIDSTALERSLRYAIERGRSKRELLRVARRDPLTGLHNRVSIEERLSDALCRATRAGKFIGVALLDLDGFKQVNDRLGHDAGDQLLKQIAACLKAAVRPYDSVGRLGGDEFVVVLEQLESCEEAMRCADRLLSATRGPHGLSVDLEISSSIGLAISRHVEGGVSELLQAADEAMYRAKRSGKNRAEFSSTHCIPTRPPSNKLELEGALARGEFSLVYQPQVDLLTGVPVGVEMLCRWTRRSVLVEEVCIADIVEDLERSGAIVELDLWCLREAVKARSLLPRTHRVSLNMSPVTLESPNILSRMLACLPNPAPWLEIEVTEGAPLVKPRVAAAVLSALRERGVRVALDDFGTGHSDLGRLRQLPVDTLKVDRSLVNSMGNPLADALIASTVDLCERADFALVVEGVETDEQASALLSIGARYAQGYFFSAPIPGSELTTWFSQCKLDAA